MITASLGCVKIYKKPRDTDSRGKYIPKHKRGPDVELFKGERHGFLSLSLTLFAPGGAHCAPPVTYLRISVQIRIQTRWKNLTSLSYEFGIGQYTF